MGLILNHCTVWDATRPVPQEDASVMVEGGRITAVKSDGGRAGRGADDQVLDLGGRFLLPGLWNAHGHIASAAKLHQITEAANFEGPIPRTIRTGKNLQDALRAGVTTLRVLGEAFGIDLAWKDAFRKGLWVGPRMIVCGSALAVTGGHGTQGGSALELDGPEAFRHAVREQVKKGADQIKVMLTSGLSSTTDSTRVELTPEELEAAVTTAHGLGVILSVHCGGAAGAKLAVDKGVDCIEHGFILDEESVQLMARHGTYFTPTVTATQATHQDYLDWGWNEFMIENGQAMREAHLRSVQMAHSSGIRICAGQDCRALPTVVDEMVLLAQCGLSTHESLIAGTSRIAELCGMADQVGTIEAGKGADLIAVEGSPVDDLRALRSLSLVVRDGRIVSNSLG